MQCAPLSDERTGKVRHGFTTGSCAAAAAKAAAYMLLSGRKKEKISIETPGGIIFNTDLSDIRLSEREASCAVKKDAGDDPDITDGTFIYAAVTYIDNTGEKSDHTKDKAVSIDSGKENDRVVIKGGRGVGRVTKPGLDQPVGEAAINHVPREMIIREVTEVMQLLDYSGRLQVEVSVPQGEVLAKKTFNPRLGIVGGISILGTTGIVEPMSEKALVDTIRVELSVHYCQGERTAVVAPGNYGLDFMKAYYGYDLDKAVKCSNFIGDTVLMAAEMGFSSFILVGHIGKLVKLAAGMLNTHSKYGDHRMEVIAREALQEGVSIETAEKILECVSTEAAIDILLEAHGRDLLERVMERIMNGIMKTLEEVCGGRMKLYCITFSSVYGFLAGSFGAEDILRKQIDGEI